MTIQQTLEKLAVVAGDWIQIDRDEDGDVIGIYIQRKGTMRKCLRIGGIDEDRVFGAICEKCKSEGWDWSSCRPLLNGEDKYEFGVYSRKHPGREVRTIGLSKSDIHPAHAAAQALLAALEAKQADCDACFNGDCWDHQNEQSIVCHYCQGTGKQSNQQEQINE